MAAVKPTSTKDFPGPHTAQHAGHQTSGPLGTMPVHRDGRPMTKEDIAQQREAAKGMTPEQVEDTRPQPTAHELDMAKLGLVEGIDKTPEHLDWRPEEERQSQHTKDLIADHEAASEARANRDQIRQARAEQAGQPHAASAPQLSEQRAADASRRRAEEQQRQAEAAAKANQPPVQHPAGYVEPDKK